MSRRSACKFFVAIIAGLLMPSLASANQAWCPAQASLDAVRETNNGALAVDLFRQAGAKIGAEHTIEIIPGIANSPDGTLIGKLMMFSIACNVVLSDASKTPQQKLDEMNRQYEKIIKAPVIPLIWHPVRGIAFHFDRGQRDPVRLWDVEISSDALVTVSLSASAGMGPGRALSVAPVINSAAEFSCPEIREVNG